MSFRTVMTDPRPAKIAQGAPIQIRCLAGTSLFAIALALSGCEGGGRMFDGTPYTESIQPVSVARVQSQAPAPAAAGAGAPATPAASTAPAASAPMAAEAPPPSAVPVAPVERSEVSPAPAPAVPQSAPAPVPAPAAPSAPAAAQAPAAAPSGEAGAGASVAPSLPRPPTPRTYPNLADVPERPTDLPSLEERQRGLAELQADQREARGAASAGSGSGTAPAAPVVPDEPPPAPSFDLSRAAPEPDGDKETTAPAPAAAPSGTVVATVPFEEGANALGRDGEDALRQAIERQKETGGILRLVGYGEEFGLRRARAVAQALMAQGVAADRIAMSSAAGSADRGVEIYLDN